MGANLHIVNRMLKRDLNERQTNNKLLIRFGGWFKGWLRGQMCTGVCLITRNTDKSVDITLF